MIKFIFYKILYHAKYHKTSIILLVNQHSVYDVTIWYLANITLLLDCRTFHVLSIPSVASWLIVASFMAAFIFVPQYRKNYRFGLETHVKRYWEHSLWNTSITATTISVLVLFSLVWTGFNFSGCPIKSTLTKKDTEKL